MAFFIISVFSGQASLAELCHLLRETNPVIVQSVSPDRDTWAIHLTRIRHPQTRISGIVFAKGPNNKLLVTSLEEHGNGDGYLFHDPITGRRLKVRTDLEIEQRRAKTRKVSPHENTISAGSSDRLIVNPSGTIAVGHSVIATQKIQRVGLVSSVYRSNSPLQDAVHFLSDSVVVSLDKYGAIEAQQVTTSSMPETIWAGRLILDPSQPNREKVIHQVAFYKNRITAVLKNGTVLVYDLKNSSSNTGFESEASSRVFDPNQVFNFKRQVKVFASKNSFHTFFVTSVVGKLATQVGRIEKSGQIVNLTQIDHVGMSDVEVIPLKGKAFAVIQNRPTRKLHFYTAGAELKSSYEFPSDAKPGSAAYDWQRKLHYSFKSLSSDYSAARGLIVIGTYHGAISLFDTRTGQLIAAFYSQELSGIGGQAHELQFVNFSADGSLLSVAGHLGAHLIYDTESLVDGSAIRAWRFR